MATRHDYFSISRRQLLAAGVGLGATGCVVGNEPAAALSEENLMGASAFSGERLSRERVKAMKPLFEFNLKHLEILREFDCDEEEPLTMFRL